jgi:hypothetical protein
VRITSKLFPLTLLFATLCFGCGGGARQASVAAWQKNVEQYVRVQGKGDPAVLRDLTLSDSRRGYAMVGGDRPAESSEANGVLLGFREVEGRGYFIYLVGVVEKQTVKEIRLAALTTDGGKVEWKVAPNNTGALSTYRAYNDTFWRQRFPERASPPPQYLGFPTPDDHFSMSVSGNRVTVTHPPSKATWQLTLPVAPRRA